MKTKKAWLMWNITTDEAEHDENNPKVFLSYEELSEFIIDNDLRNLMDPVEIREVEIKKRLLIKDNGWSLVEENKK